MRTEIEHIHKHLDQIENARIGQPKHVPQAYRREKVTFFFVFLHVVFFFFFQFYRLDCCLLNCRCVFYDSYGRFFQFSAIIDTLVNKAWKKV